MTRKERFERWLQRGLFESAGLSNLDDADALEEMRAAHAAFCEDKRLESEKDRIEAELKAAGDRLVAALAGYGKLHDLPWPFDPPSPVGFQIKD